MYPGGVTPAVEEYDPATDTWTYKADLPTARLGLATGAIEGTIFAIGGVAGDLTAPALQTVEAYNPATDAWTQKTDMPTARGYFSTSVLNGKIYAVGGTPSNWKGNISTVEEYDPVTDTWTKGPNMPTARAMPSSGVVDNKIYVIGGTTAYWPWSGAATVEEYDLGPTPSVSLIWEGGKIKLTCRGILQSADTLNGPTWQDVTPAPKCPWVFDPAQSGTMKFYRARQP